ncbi:hypothetical protein [Winogradskyella haliclonae]|uniref:MG2 domain protein n=1 Tax=Winogradskyella haliclonae TaxID=2048558 RepID=A0ABQ2BW45_9FLAO|nr:hypothetical protein [Winogradskyella haliclonae]GGI55972.1 hypothetical protein GCM10011444_02810 [Winogradskyella haliclonae]
MGNRIQTLLLGVFFFMLKSSLFSQTNENIKHEAFAEKIYLQLDSNIYTSDKTIWFKAILANAVTHNLEITSGVLNVDLINSENEIVESKLLKIKNGIGEGFFDLNRSYREGNYQIRAYSELNKNFGDDFIAKKYIKIFSDIPSSIDDELVRDKTLNNKDLSEVVEILDLRLQFFPEGGKMVRGLPIKIGFKVTDNNGKSIVANGEIVNERDEVLSTFKSNEVGLGHFLIKDLPKTGLYKARVLNKDGKTYKYYHLPEIQELGYTLSVSERKEFLIVAIRTNILNNDKLILKGSVRGKEYFSQEVSLIENKYIFTIPKSTFPNGIIIFQLSNKNYQAISERLYFNELSERYLDINAKFSSMILEKRKTVNIDLGFNNQQSITEEDASASILVLDKSLYGDIENERDNILSYFLLSSDIKGKIDKPGRYFSRENRLNVDDLMLTQGWRNYKYVTPKQKLDYKLEKGLSIKGVINVKNSNFKQEDLDVMMTTLGNDYSIYSGSLSVPGSFDFRIDDLYGNEKKMIFKPNGLNDKESRNYDITLNKRKRMIPDFIYNESEKIIKQDTSISRLVKTNRNQLNKLNKYYTNITGVTELDEVIIDAYKMTPKRKEMFDKYGEPDVVINGEDLLEKNPKWSSGLFDVISSGFRDKLYVTREIGSTSLSVKSIKHGKGYVTLWVVDGVPVMKDNYDLLQYIRPEEITSLEVIENAKKLKELISIVNGEPPPFGIVDGAVISIYTKANKGLYGALDLKKGVKIHTISVFSTVKEFYVPDHEDSFSSINSEPDLRSTIYWNPDVKMNSNNSNKVKYSHSDNTGEFLVIVEAVTKDGRVGYKTVEYSVIESKK